MGRCEIFSGLEVNVLDMPWKVRRIEAVITRQVGSTPLLQRAGKIHDVGEPITRDLPRISTIGCEAWKHKGPSYNRITSISK